MAWIRNWSWKLALLALPWQTRVFYEGPSLGGLPWEQGRWAFYLAWVPMILVIVAACREPFKPAEHPLPPRAWVTLVGLFLVALPACFSIFPAASVQWLVQVTLLSLFGWAMLHLRIDRRSVLTWSAYAIVPHALLGIGQFLSQTVVGSKWLGVASQLPADLGVSVIEASGRRVLRAYGGFPHPNILGGWLAFGLVAATQLKNKKLLTAYCSLFTVALVLTFSRSAWIASALGLAVSFSMLWRKAWTLDEKQRVLSLGAVILVSAGLVGFMARDLVFVRFSNDTRLEQASTNERTVALSSAWKTFLTHPILGTGQGTGILALDRAGFGIVPPHFVFLLILLETGIVGFAGVLLLGLRWMRSVGSAAVIPLVVLTPLLLLDHYLWSLWAGQALLALIVLAPLTEEKK